MLSDRRASLRDGRFQLQPISFRQRAQLRHDQLVDEIENAGVLLDGCFGVNSRDSCGVQHLAHLAEQARYLREPRRHMTQPIGQRRKVASHQQVNAVPRQLRIEEGIPSPFLQLLAVPDFILEFVGQESRIDLMGARELRVIQSLKLREQITSECGASRLASRADIIEQSVIAMLSQRGRGNRSERQHFFQEAI